MSFELLINHGWRYGFLLSAMSSDDWCVVVFKCLSEKAEDILVEFYDFAANLEGVNSLHFIIRDRVADELVFSFRLLVESEGKKLVTSKIVFKLKGLMSEDKFAVDPDVDNPLQKYAAWSPMDVITKCGVDRFTTFYNVLNQLSELVVGMVKNNYFDSYERVEIAHVMSWMLGCTEYGSLSTKHMEVGYYDRIKDKCHPYLRESFSK